MLDSHFSIFGLEILKLESEISVKKSKGIANAMIATIILFPLIGFGLSYAMLQPSINGLQASTTELQTDVTGLQTSLGDLQEAYITASARAPVVSSPSREKNSSESMTLTLLQQRSGTEKTSCWENYGSLLHGSTSTRTMMDLLRSTSHSTF